MGVATTLLTDRLAANAAWRYLIPIGFIGAYTTFSTFEMEIFRANTEGAWLIGGAYLVASVVAGYVALWCGVVVGRLL
jgi:CrcB protein